MAEGDQRATDDPLAVTQASSPFRAGPARDPADTGSACRFLVLERPDGSVVPAFSGIDVDNRCVAVGEPVPQSGRQQELVCLAAAHVNCPRYLRGVLAAGTLPPPPRREPVSPAVIGAALVLAAALAASFGFLAVRGGFNLPQASPTPAQVSIVASPAPAPTPNASVTVAPTPSSTPSLSPSPLPSVEPSPTTTAAPTPTPTRPAATPTPAATSDRFALLTKCPSTPDCWIYVIRAGDNLRSIANYFGVSYSRMVAMNPSLATPIHAGDKLRIPTPTR